MSVADYCRGQIRFRSNDRQRPEIRYSDRSIIELRQNELADYSIRAVDVDNNREIFNIPINKADAYKRSQSSGEPDYIKIDDGIYYIWLDKGKSNLFYETLATAIAEIELIKGFNVRSPSPATKVVQQPKTTVESPMPSNDQNDILVDIHELGQSIREGNTNEAIALSKKLAHRRVALQAIQTEQLKDESRIQIKIEIDSNDEDFRKRYPARVFYVYPSTTIRELRVALQYVYNRLPPSQHFFVNGHLAHDSSTMRDLRVQSNSLFILFVIQP